jgi:hypothetical protein
MDPEPEDSSSEGMFVVKEIAIWMSTVDGSQAISA